MKLFEKVDLYAVMTKPEDFRFYCDMPQGLMPGDFEKKLIKEKAELALKEEIPALTATDYMRFVRDGNRSEFEGKYFRRRTMLRAMTMAEYFDKQGRYLDKIIDVIWAICEETTWVIPAHNRISEDQAEKTTLLTRAIDGRAVHIDLFAAETGAELANTLYYLRDRLDAVTDLIAKRVDYCIEKQLLEPFESKLFWWEGYYGGILNNWNPWIISNILYVIAVQEKEPIRRVALCEKAKTMLDHFVDSYHIDGGCDEGPSYWSAAAASLYDCLEIFYDLTGGKVNVFKTELVNNMCDYFRKAYIAGNYVMNFADAPATIDVSTQARLLWRMSRRIGNKEMGDFASYVAYNQKKDNLAYGWGTYVLYRTIRDMNEQVEAYKGGGISTHAEFPGIMVSVIREKEAYDEGFFFAIKGGTNGESHNHNDVGNFVLYRDGKPLLIDIGVGTYSRKTFGAERYTILPMTSAYHNLPEIGGCTQLPGLEYSAKNPVFTPWGLSVDIDACYPEKAGLLHYRRSGCLKDGKMEIIDELTLKESKEIIFNFISFEKPTVLENGRIDLGGAVFTYPCEMEAWVEDYVFDDVRFNKTWMRDRVYRLRIKTAVEKGSFTFIVK